jgi:uncharacterized protein YndB with AHSA1/START domain
MNSDPRAVVRVTRRFSGSPQRVFDAWLDASTAGKWLFATPSGQMVRVEIDPRVGGRFNFVDRRDGEDIEHTGEYHEIDPPRRLVFSFSVPKFSSENTRVTIEVAPLEKGCELTLTHENVYRDYASRTEAGWTNILAALATTVE